MTYSAPSITVKSQSRNKKASIRPPDFTNRKQLKRGDHHNRKSSSLPRVICRTIIINLFRNLIAWWVTQVEEITCGKSWRSAAKRWKENFCRITADNYLRLSFISIDYKLMSLDVMCAYGAWIERAVYSLDDIWLMLSALPNLFLMRCANSRGFDITEATPVVTPSLIFPPTFFNPCPTSRNTSRGCR